MKLVFKIKEVMASEKVQNVFTKIKKGAKTVLMVILVVAML